MGVKHCWEIKKCGRQPGGEKVAEFGECIAVTETMTHSCWVVAGTLCGGVVQGSVAQKQKNCFACEVFALFSRSSGAQREQIAVEYPYEQERYLDLMRKRAHRND